MTSTAQSALRLSVPPPMRLSRPLTETELRVLQAVADVLIPAASDNPAATSESGYEAALITATTARADAFATIVATLAVLADLEAPTVESRLRQLHDEQPDVFQPLSAVVAGAWLVLPAVRARIGYPGQHRNPAPITQAVDELTSGILETVIQRGHIYREPPPDSPQA